MCAILLLVLLPAGSRPRGWRLDGVIENAHSITVFGDVVCDCLDIVCDNFTLALQLMREIKTRSQHLNSLI